MKIIKYKWLFAGFLLTIISSFSLNGQLASDWPMLIEGDKQQIKLYKPTIEQSDNQQLGFRAAISITDQGNSTPLFGSVWGNFSVNNSSGTTVPVLSADITDIRFPDGITADERTKLATQIQDAVRNQRPVLLGSDISNSLKDMDQEKKLAAGMDNKPPKILYTDQASILVNIDGEPVVQNTETTGVDMVMNTPFLILKYQNYYYLSNGKIWYKSTSAISGFMPEKSVPNIVKTTAESLKSDDEENVAETKDDFYPKIIISTVPAELIQTDGNPSFSAIPETDLLFISNTEEQMLLDIGSQKYYVLISGRWYSAKRLDSAWSYVTPENLPADFAKIPEGTEKDIVLASIPGTMASREAIQDAQIPQVAMVNRKSAKSEVIYDGDPDFEQIPGTDMRVSVNSSNPVIQEQRRYYLVDNGVWFVSSSPNGPWEVSDQRPAQVNEIPPTSSVYNVKYVYVYDATPDVVYVGYTSGYLCSYVVNRTVVYGTGFHYRPWSHRYYFPRPHTWGFGMCYNPWYGWSVNMCYGIGGYGWFGYHHYHHYRPGWWGPSIYRPPYRPPYSHYYGKRPATQRPIHYGNATTRPVSRPRPTNLYNTREVAGVRPTRDRPANTRPATRETYNYSNTARPVQPAGTRPTTRPTTPGSTRPGQNTNTRPATPGQTTRPSTPSPSVRPATPGQSTRPATPSPSVRPATPSPSVRPIPPGQSTRPATPGPSVRPAPGSGTRPSTPSPSVRPAPSQPATRPGPTTPGSGTRPATRPATSQQAPAVRPTVRLNASATATKDALRPVISKQDIIMKGKAVIKWLQDRKFAIQHPLRNNQDGPDELDVPPGYSARLRIMLKK